MTVTDIDENLLSLARSCGTYRVLDACDERVFEQLKDGGPYDLVIDGSGYKNLFFDIQEHALLARRGFIGALAVRGETTLTGPCSTNASCPSKCHAILRWRI